MGDDRIFDYGADDRPRVGASADNLQQLTHLCEEQERLEDEVAALETQLKAKQAELNDVAGRQIPELLKACRLKEQKFTDGRVVKLDAKWKAGLYEDPEQRLAQIDWLDRHGQSAIVKRKLACLFPREQVALMDVVAQKIAAESGDISIAKTFDVHNGQLVAAIKGMLAEGVDVPLKLFQAFEIRRAKIIRPK